MELIRGIHNIRAHHQGCVLTIGNFDGVPHGHSMLLDALQREGQRLSLPTCVMIFEPQPQELFAGNRAPARLSTFRDKTLFLAQAGIDRLLCVKFNHQVAAISPQQFIEQWLVEKLGVKSLLIGDDFRFGSQRAGNFSLLQQAGEQFGFTVTDTASFCRNGKRISSTAIREALQKDDLLLAEALLGRPYSISGRVVHGDAIGRTLGFPTANLRLNHQVLPVSGVYAVDVAGIGSHSFPGVANIGTRPTLSGIRQQLEVYLLDVKMDLYGQHINVILRKKLRNEQRFASLDELKQQIAQDVTMTRHYFGITIPS